MESKEIGGLENFYMKGSADDIGPAFVDRRWS
jgi:hypothetical protein